MASYLKSQNLTNGVEEVNKKIEVSNGGAWLNLERINVRRDGGSGVIRLGEIGSDHEKGELYIVNGESDSMLMSYSNNSTVDLPLSIKNTKATLEDGDILVFDDTDSTFKVDNISNYVGGGGGNTYTISLPFSKGGGNVNGSVTVPTNAVLLNCWIKVEDELSTTGAPFTIRLDGSTPLVIAVQGTDFFENVGSSQFYNFQTGTSEIEPSYKVLSTDSGVLQANHSGSGFGSGIIYLQYSTELS